MHVLSIRELQLFPDFVFFLFEGCCAQGTGDPVQHLYSSLNSLFSEEKTHSVRIFHWRKGF